MLETLNYTIHIGSTPTFLSNFDLNLNTVLVLCTTRIKAFLRLQDDVNSRRDESCLLKRKPRYEEDQYILMPRIRHINRNVSPGILYDRFEI